MSKNYVIGSNMLLIRLQKKGFGLCSSERCRKPFEIGDHVRSINGTTHVTRIMHKKCYEELYW